MSLQAGQGGDRSTTRRVAGAAAVLVLCAPFVYGAIGAFPIWDDAWLWLLLREQGVDAVMPSHPDRPVNAALWEWLAARGALFPVGFVAQAIFWPLLGGITALLWTKLFPLRRRFAALAACLAVAPFATQIHMVTVTVALASLLPVLLAYAAVLLAWRYVARGSWTALLAALPVLTVGVLVQEYALVAGFVGLVLMSSQLLGTPEIRRRALVAIPVLAVANIAAYVLYLAVGEPESRPEAQPQYALRMRDQVADLASRLAIAVWRGLGGGLADATRDLFAGLGQMPVGVLLGALLSGVIVGAFLLYSLGRASTRRDEHGPRGLWSRDVALLVGLAIGILPILLMDRIPWDPADGMSSRFGLPVVPVIAVILTRCVGLLERFRLAAVAVALLALVAGGTAVTDAHRAVEERELMTELGEVIRPHVARHERMMVVVVPQPSRGMGPSRPWELVARLSADWPQRLGNRLWAHPYGDPMPERYNHDARRKFGPRDNCRFPGRLRRHVRLLQRRGCVHTLAWLGTEADGSIDFEPYCREEPPRDRALLSRCGRG
ncbi:MAG: hypothetical protein ACRD2Z_04230 [Thermoanaerobaculia bacterium]